LKHKSEELTASLDGDLCERYLFVLRQLSQRINQMQRQLADIDAYLMTTMQPYAWAYGLLQTVPGIDQLAAALILTETLSSDAGIGTAHTKGSAIRTTPSLHHFEGEGLRRLFDRSNRRSDHWRKWRDAIAFELADPKEMNS